MLFILTNRYSYTLQYFKSSISPNLECILIWYKTLVIPVVVVCLLVSCRTLRASHQTVEQFKQHENHKSISYPYCIRLLQRNTTSIRAPRSKYVPLLIFYLDVLVFNLLIVMRKSCRKGRVPLFVFYTFIWNSCLSKVVTCLV